MKVSFWDLSWVILGRMMEARDEAEVLEEPGAECSARMVVRWAIHELGVRWLVFSARLGFSESTY